MKKNVIISLADYNYFELLNELVDSIKRFKQSEDTAICILDGGLTEEQKKILASKVDEIKSSEWDIKISQFKTRGKKCLKSLMSLIPLVGIFISFILIYFYPIDRALHQKLITEIQQRGEIND